MNCRNSGEISPRNKEGIYKNVGIVNKLRRSLEDYASRVRLAGFAPNVTCFILLCFTYLEQQKTSIYKCTRKLSQN